jgi:hypothetical protein
MIKKFESFSQELKDYVNGKTKLTPQMNILINDRSKDWYAEVGKYFVDLFDGDLPGGLSFYNDKIDKLGVFDKLSGKSERLYSNIGIFIFTSIFDEEVLKKIFGDPLYHDEFGEGFEGEYDEETDEYSEPENKFQYASYFIEIDGVKFHIGYDHRGTSMEVEIGTSPQKVFDCIKSLIDKYKINLNF